MYASRPQPKVISLAWFPRPHITSLEPFGTP